MLNVLNWILLPQVGPRLPKDRERFPPNNMLLVLTGAGLLWLGWSGFNGGATFSANLISGLAVLNTHVCAAASLLTWTALDVIVFGKPSVIGAVQGMMTGLVVITPAAGKPRYCTRIHQNFQYYGTGLLPIELKSPLIILNESCILSKCRE